ncbi:enoyl-CoA hydratase-related protein [Oryzicola mucosus]|uniref:Enoyl-CoA hydratase/isomerase family protein n=1 Tax=Oryzicola mucosus TaxID=2767425 RepID=A0A8J6PQB8_9HYPH|nr:enoyl-CoA hydratase-related protein [Oryzicola mucosus]MBD0416752.1 enoyl-CoA hydratase/isomerase family protein [Oryzicola mucosus]
MTSTGNQDLIVTTEGHVRILRMNRPRARNALSVALRDAISSAIVTGDRDPQVRAIVITGSDTCFSAGGDIKEFPDAANQEDSMFVSQRIWSPLGSCRVPLIAAVEGIALGGGAEFAMLCDIIIAGDTAEFAFPEVRLGILPGNGGTQRFPRAVGKYKAMRYLLTGDRISAGSAAEMGLVSEVVEAGSAFASALALAQRIAELPPLAVRQIKDVVTHGADAPLSSALNIEREGSRLLMRTSDHKEASNAFIQKRRPVFTGK